MKLHTFLYDLDYLLGDFPNVEGARLTPTPSGVRIQANSQKEPLFVADGQTIEPVDGITDLCGILSMGRLRDILRAPGFSRASVQSAVSSGTIELSDGLGQSYSFYLFDKRMTNDCINPISLKAHPTYELEADLTSEGRELLKYWQRQLVADGESEGRILYDVFTRGGNLIFRNGYSRPDSAFIEFPFIRGVKGTYSTRYREIGANLLPLLRFVGNTAGARLKLWSAGVHTVAVTTASVSMNFHVPQAKP